MSVVVIYINTWSSIEKSITARRVTKQLIDMKLHCKSTYIHSKAAILPAFSKPACQLVNQSTSQPEPNNQNQRRRRTGDSRGLKAHEHNQAKPSNFTHSLIHL